MSEEAEVKRPEEIFDLAEAQAQDEADFVVRHPKTDAPTTWIWTFFGPGHPNTIAVSNKAAKTAIRESKAQQEARVNGKKWKADEVTIDELRVQYTDNIIGRTKAFTPIKFGSETIEYSPEAVRKFLMDRKMSWLLMQIINFLEEDANFIKPSVVN